MWGVHEVEIKVCSKCGQTLPMDLDVFVDGGDGPCWRGRECPLCGRLVIE